MIEHIKRVSVLIQYFNHVNEVIDENTRRGIVEGFCKIRKRNVEIELELGYVQKCSAYYAYYIDTMRFNFFDYLVEMCVAEHIVKHKPIHICKNMIDEYFGYFNFFDTYDSSHKITREDFEYLFDQTITGYLVTLRYECELELSIFDFNKTHRQIKKYFETI